jgi:HEAT repeat protein
MSGQSIDWGAIAEELATITSTDCGRNERGGSDVAREALVKIIGDNAFRDAVDFYLSGQPGNELARSVLGLLRPPAAMERCLEVFRTSRDEQIVAAAVELLGMLADSRALDWIPEFLASDNVGARVWAVGIIDQLLIMTEEIEFNDAEPLIEIALNDSDERVRKGARQVLEMLEQDAAVKQ